MKRALALALLATVIVPSYPSAESLSERLAKKNVAFKAEMSVACGKLNKANCNQVLNALADQSIQRGLTLRPEESEGSFESAEAICAGLVDAAIGQKDAFDLARTKVKDCRGKYEQVGKALYPYYGYLVVRADAPFDSLTAMIEQTQDGKSRQIAAGKLGSGGQTTLGFILRNDPASKRVIAPNDAGPETALQRVYDGGLDGFFFMDAPASELVDSIRNNQDKDGKPKYKFIDISFSDNFYTVRAWDNKLLYQKQTLAKGTGYLWFGDGAKYTISTDAAVFVSNDYRNNETKNGPKAVDALATSIDTAEGAIYGDTKTPRDWRPASSR